MLCQEYNKYYEKYNDNTEYLDHKPAIGGHTLKILEKFAMSCLNVHLGLLCVGIDS